MKISVVVTLYNKRKTIHRALRSVFNQTFQPFEIIVVDDGSTDGSREIVDQINHPLLKLVTQGNGGVSSARNRGISEARGAWITFLDADDEWMPEFLKTIYFLFKKYPECSVFATSYLLMDNFGNQKSITLNNLPFVHEDGILINYFEVASCSHPPICSNSLAVKASDIISIGRFPIGIQSGEDLLTWARLAVKFKIAYTIRPQSVFLQDEAHTYINKPSRFPQIPDIVGKELALLAKQNVNIKGIKKYVALWFKMRASLFLRLGLRKKALYESMKSITYNPLNIKIYCYFLMIAIPSSLSNRIFRKFGNP
jgi:glycosyltransferase involved in cell wall biosynthesis